MTYAPRLPKRPTEQDYRLRDVQWHLRELADIEEAARNGERINLMADLGHAVRRP